VLVLVASACGSRHAEPAVPSAEAVAGKLPEGPPLVTPGERMSYRLEVGGMDLATYDIGVGDVTSLGDHEAIVVQSHAKAKPLVAMVTNIDEVFTSWLDVRTGRPLRWTVEERDVDGKVREFTDVRLDQRTGDRVPVEVRDLDQPAALQSQQVSMPEVWDYNALTIALRAWEAEPGTTTTAEVLRGRYLWHVTITVRGREKVVTDLGDFPALRFDGRSYRLDRDGQRDTSAEQRSFSLWISDDDGRVPLQNVAESDFGTLEMTLVDYQPGNGHRLRP
jgi:hypothetical protein